jgi:hypothetical protein
VPHKNERKKREQGNDQLENDAQNDMRVVMKEFGMSAVAFVGEDH